MVGSAAAVGTGVVLGSGLVGMREAYAKVKRDPDLQVPRKTLGKTGEKIPILVFGAAVDLDSKFDPKLAAAYRYGVDYIDAAQMYGGGTCESAVGNFHKKAKLRDELWITTKSTKHDVKGFNKTVESSLSELQTETVDLYFLHALKKKKYLSKDMEKNVAKLKKDKKIRFFGFSCHNDNVAELMMDAADKDWVDVIMFRYNFRTYGDKELNKAIDACAKANIGLIAMKTQGSAVSFKDEWKKFKKSGGYTKHQAVLKAVWADDRITAAVSHMDSLKKLRENVAAALNKKKLSRAELDELDRYAEATAAYACNGCDHLCNPAVDAPIRIGDTMRYLMYHDVYDEKAKARRLFSELPSGARAVSTADYARAEAACPYGIKIAEHMRRAGEVLS